MLDRYPRSTRPIEMRGNQTTPRHREIARRFDKEFFDGDRLHGYGGYSYNPRFWQETVRRFRDHYGLAADSSVLDVGCAKGYMLYDFKELMPGLKIAGLDISEYAIKQAIESVKPELRVGDATRLPYEDNSFDLVISINTVHNLPLEECKTALKEIERVSKAHSFITVDSWRNEDQEQAFLKWNLTALTYMHVENWEKMFAEIGYSGDYYWFIAE